MLTCFIRILSCVTGNHILVTYHLSLVTFHNSYKRIEPYSYFSFLYKYLVMKGMYINEKIPSPRTNSIPAPGQCIVLNRIPKIVIETDRAPELNAIAFILKKFIGFPTRLAFRFRPVIKMFTDSIYKIVAMG
jgi:hypothetical protein